MKKLLPLLLFGSTFLIVSCESEKKVEIKKIQEEFKLKLSKPKEEDLEKLKNTFKAILPQDWQILDIYSVEPSEEKYLKKYLIRVYSPYYHAVFNRFVWLTNDDKVLFLNGYLLGQNSVFPIVPPKEKEYPLENVSWILDIERILFTYNIPAQLTNGKKVVYIVWNPFCKSCFENWKNLIEEAKRENLAIKLIPYHSVYYPIDNLYMLIYILYRAQKEGLLTVLNSYYTNSKSFEEFLEKLKKEAYANLKSIPKKEYNTLGFALKEINKILYQAKVFAVPTTVKVVKVETDLGLAKGYVYTGVLKLK